MTGKWRFALGLALALISTSFEARADKVIAKREYEAGTQDYNLRRFEAAIEHYRRAYEAFPAPELLFNIGQAYRKLADCENAIFYYERFLDQQPKTRVRQEVEQHLVGLKTECSQRKKRKAEASATANEALGPNGTRVVVPGQETRGTLPKEGRGVEPTKYIEEKPETKPLLETFAFHLDAGIAFPAVSGLDSPAQPLIRIGAGVPLSIGPLRLEPGISAGWAQLEFSENTTGQLHTWALLGRVIGSYPIDSIEARAELGVGTLLLTSPSGAHPLVNNPNDPFRRLLMLHVRLAVGADIPIIKNIWLNVTPFAFSVSPSVERMPTIRRIESTVGVISRE